MIDKRNPNQILQLIENSSNIDFLKELGNMLEVFIEKLNKKLLYYNENKLTLRRIKLLERRDEYQELLKYLDKKITRIEKESIK